MSEKPRYRAYLLRLWLADDNGRSVWRAALEDPRSGEQLGFANVGQLFAFLEEQLAPRPSASAPVPVRLDASTQRGPERH